MTRWPPPLIKISLLLKHQRPKLKICRAASLDIILKIAHAIFCTYRIISKGRKLPKVLEYSELFLQLPTWYKHLDSLDIVRNLQQIHSNRINHELYSEPTFPSPQLYLLRHTLRCSHTVKVCFKELFLCFQKLVSGELHTFYFGRFPSLSNILILSNIFFFLKLSNHAFSKLFDTPPTPSNMFDDHVHLECLTVWEHL